MVKEFEDEKFEDGEYDVKLFGDKEFEMDEKFELGVGEGC